jgi:hypothetical protein
MKQKNWFFEKINKIDKPLAKMTKRRRERPKLIKLEMNKRDIRTDTKEIHMIKREYFENLYSNKLENLN